MQRHKMYGLVLTGLLTLVVVSGCTDRGTNVPDPTDLSKWGIATAVPHVFSPELRFQLANPNELLSMSIYIPKDAFDGKYKVPVLVLLAPDGGSQYFYFNHGLFQLAEEMIAKGEIKPMAILCIGNDPLFGGYFYANSFPGGLMDSIVGKDLIDYLYAAYPMLIQDPSKRGIGGMGMGAYGAFRAAMKHPGSYQAISVVDGPLDFDGADGKGGFYSLFDDVIAEQGLAPGDLFQEFDSAATMPLSRLFIGAALAFSPHDTAMTFTFTPNPADPIGLPPLVTITNRYQLADSSTLVDQLVTSSPGIGDVTPYSTTGFDFHLPFDENGIRKPQIWNMWLDNNLETMYDAAGTPLTGINVWIGTNKQGDKVGATRFGFREQTLSFVSFLENRGVTPVVQEFEGYSGYDAQGSRFIYDQMREMLKFQSAAFNGNE